MAIAAGRGRGPCARCARCTIRPGPRTAMSAIAGGRSRRLPGGWMPSSGRRRSPHCRPTRVARSNPQPFEEAMLATPRRAVVLEPPKDRGRDRPPPPIAPVPPRPLLSAACAGRRAGQCAAAGCRRRDDPRRGGPPRGAGHRPNAGPSPAPAEPAPSRPAPLFRSRQDIPKAVPAPIPAVIPLIRAPDDPGVDDDGPADEFAEQIGPPKAQAGGWRGFLSRWGGN